jgi:2-C-methyl-D-erythritol 4-phosphate cytidylyltransferase
MKRCCIIVAGGQGLRMGGDTPKQFLPLGDKTILMHTLCRFHEFDPHMKIVVVLPEEHISEWESQKRQYSFNIEHIVVAGGKERFYSVKAGLEQTEESSMVAIHDGVRPFVSHDTIRRCFKEAERCGMAIPFVEPNDSVRIQREYDSVSVPRKTVRLIQTPQVFRSDLIKEAYKREYDAGFTDDASVAEAAGYKVNLVQGNRENIKITRPEDIIIARAIHATMPR